MEDMNWVARLAYLSECHVFLVHDKVSAFRKKLDLWCARVEQGSVEIFPALEDVLEKAGLAVASVQQVATVH